MTALREAISAATATLAAAGIDCARTDAELLAAHAAGIERGRLALVEVADSGFADRYGEAIRRRARRTPLQHITGTVAFGPVQLRVGPGVFIPRPETESILEWILAQHLRRNAMIVDLCTGCGALAVALATERPEARVIAVDDDAAALQYAAHNAATTGVRLVEADVTDPDLLADVVGAVDLVVANPPYIPAGVELEPEVARFDPPHALFGGTDGMAVIRPVVRSAARLLRPGGLLALEHDDTTAEATMDVISATDAFDDIAAHDDLAGRPRFVTARRRVRR
jgi:release factor glutamine methyltransferase